MAEEEKRVTIESTAVPAWVFRPWREEIRALKETPGALSSLEGDLKALIASSGLEARFCLYDYAAGKDIQLEAHRPFYPASMIKTLLLLAVLEQVEQGRLSLDRTHTLRESDKFAGKTPVAGTGVLQFAEEGSSYTLEELLALMIILSDNVATNIIFDLVGAEGCAATARRLGLERSAFTRKMYDLESELPSNVATAYELTRMLMALHERKVAGEALTRKGIALMAAAADKGRIGRYIREQAVVANKVGTVTGIVGDMALLYFPHRPPVALAAVVIDPPSQDRAAALIGRLAELAVKALA